MSKLNQTEQGSRIARAVWAWLTEQESVELVPWVTDPKSDRFDPAKAADQEGYKRCLMELREVIEEKSREMSQ